jgi:ArsR family transcriptional regulator, arsenate/arsenite/antimonite-responsive transcriptional repressor
LDDFKIIVRALKALSDENRMRIMGLLDGSEKLCVCEITAIIGLSQPTISSHLKLLENAGLISHEKDGLWVNYCISADLEPDIKAILVGVLPVIRKSKTIKDDIGKLSKADRDRLCSRSRSL